MTTTRRIALALNLAVVTMATLALTSASATAQLQVYEPFNYADGELNGQGGALGTTCTWQSFDSIQGSRPIASSGWWVHQEGSTSGVGLSNANPSNDPGGFHPWTGTVANLPTSGAYVGLPGAADIGDADPFSGEPGRNMNASIGLDPSVTGSFQTGATTWLSYVSVRGWDRNEEHPNLVLGTDPAPDGSRGDNYGGIGPGGSGFGTGGGPTRNNRTDIYPMFYEDGQYNNVNGAIPGNAYNQGAFEVSPADGFDWVELTPGGDFGPPNIVVMKLEWNADTGGEDIISVARFLEDDILSEANFDALIAAQPNLSSVNWIGPNKPDLDETQLDTLTFMGLKFFVNDVRLGTSFDAIAGNSVAAVPEPASIAIWSLLGLGLAGFGVYRARRKI